MALALALSLLALRAEEVEAPLQIPVILPLTGSGALLGKQEQIRDYVAELRGYAGINGLCDFAKFPQRGLGEANVVMSRWNDSASYGRS